MNDEYQTLVRDCAEQGKALSRMMAADGTIEPLYLYHRPSKPGHPGRLLLIRDSKTPTNPADHGLVLTTGEGLRGNVPYEQFFQWVCDRARRAPILSIE
jgi:hypothetical protein